MKNLLYLSTLLLVLMFGCAKEETQPTTAIVDDVISYEAYVFNAGAVTSSWEKTTISNAPSNLTTASSRSNSVHTHGNFTVGNGANVGSFSGTQNNGGTHGTAVIESTYNLSPTISATMVISLDTECVMVEGNIAVYGGMMTEVVGSPFPPEVDPFVAGNFLYFRVVDNGQGNNAPTDQFTSAFYSSSTSLCEILVPSHPNWFSQTLPYPPFQTYPIPTLDVESESDKIKVN